MTGKRKRYSAEFKAKVALEAIRGELTAAQLAAKHGAHRTRPSDHGRRMEAPGHGGAGLRVLRQGGGAEAAQSVEVEKLHAKIGQLLVERDFLARASGR